MTTTTQTVSVATFKRFMCGEGGRLAAALLKAREFAAAERKRVDAYVEPLFKTFGFRNKRTGELIERADRLYLAGEDDRDGDDRQAAFFAACDAAHRAHGFTGPEGHCPALVAECCVMDAERALLVAAGKVLGFNTDYLYGKNREKMLDLLIGAHGIQGRK